MPIPEPLQREADEAHWAHVMQDACPHPAEQILVTSTGGWTMTENGPEDNIEDYFACQLCGKEFHAAPDEPSDEVETQS